jgi:hypothetical protein
MDKRMVKRIVTRPAASKPLSVPKTCRQPPKAYKSSCLNKRRHRLYGHHVKHAAIGAGAMAPYKWRFFRNNRFISK